MNKVPELIASVLVVLSLLVVTKMAYARDTGYRSPLYVEGATTVSVDEAKWLYDEGAVFIDVRNPRLFARRHIPASHHLDLKYGFTQQTLAAVAGKDQPIVIYSSGIKCSRAYKASMLAVRWGYRRVYYFRGGIVDWRDVQFPLVSGA